MRTAAEEMREDNIGHIGREIIDGVPLGGTETAASVYMSPAEERPTKNRTSQNIRCGIKKTERASQLDYRARDCSGILWQ